MRVISLALFAALIATTALSEEESETGWWIVIASFRNDGAARNDSSIRLASQQVARCGLRAFNDFSSKFSGFQSGYDVVVVGAYPVRSSADRYLRQVQRCVPSAYLKEATYLGE